MSTAGLLRHVSAIVSSRRKSGSDDGTHYCSQESSIHRQAADPVKPTNEVDGRGTSRPQERKISSFNV